MGAVPRIFPGSALRCRKGTECVIGNQLKMDSYATVSVVGKGRLEIGNNVGIGMHNAIVCHEHIKIGDNTILAPNVMIYDHDHIFDPEHGVRIHEYKKSPVAIGKNCWIGANTVILRGTTIGDNCVVGAGCVLKGEYKSGTVIIQKRETVIHGG